LWLIVEFNGCVVKQSPQVCAFLCESQHSAVQGVPPACQGLEQRYEVETDAVPLVDALSVGLIFPPLEVVFGHVLKELLLIRAE
jgi:hypothetical protein